MTEEEQKDLHATMVFNGYSTCETNFFDTKEYKKLRNTMLEYFPFGNPKRFNFDFFPKSEILASGKYVIDKHFGKVDLRVPYTDGDDMESQIIALFGKEPTPDQYDDIVDYIKNKVNLVNITEIPVYLDMQQSSNGFLSSTRFYDYDIVTDEFFKKVPNCVREIIIEGDCDDNTKCIYVHEMSHGLINRYKGNIQNLLNEEAFPIFMEKVAASDLEDDDDFLDLKNLYRILQIKHNVFDKEILEFREENALGILHSKAYIFAALNATALFNTYSKGSKRLKDEMDAYLGEVISGNAILEDVFAYYSATPEKGSRIMQRQIKTYSKKFC